MISNAVYITSFISVTAIFIFGSYFQRRTEKMAAKSREENIKSNNELIATLESLNVSASQLNTFKHHIRILLVELERDREERTSLDVKARARRREFRPKTPYRKGLTPSQLGDLKREIYEREEMLAIRNKMIREAREKDGENAITE